MIEKIKNIGLIVLAALLCVALAFGGYFFFANKQIRERESQARVSAQNTIAQLSTTMKEGNMTWSRLAQEKDIEISSLGDALAEMRTAIQERDERITTLTEINAQLRTIRVVIRRENVTQTPEPGEPERIRVEFNQVWEDFMRVSGFTLTNPAEAEIQLDYTRPARITVATTQRPDLSWNTWVTTDIPNLEIGEINATVNPLSRPHEEPDWYDGIYLGVGGMVGVQGQMGESNFSFGYDFGDLEIGIILGAIVTSNGVDFAPGLEFRLSPFAL